MAKKWRFYGKILIFIGIPCIVLIGFGAILIGVGLWMRGQAAQIESLTGTKQDSGE